MKKLWQGSGLNNFIEAFETEGDLVLDQKLVTYDVYGTLAHVAQLVKLDILTPSEYKLAYDGLLEVLASFEQGEFVLEMGDEDIHSKIEQFVTEKYGEVGKKIHTGRSRNDQILTALRLYQKEKLLHIGKLTINLASQFVQFAKDYQFIPLPGYTHTQKAMPATFGMWAGAFAESLMDDIKLLKVAYNLNNQSPLGSAAGYGVPLELDREFTSQLLGFESVQVNSLYCQNSRGKLEFAFISALTSVFMTLNKFASDVLFFTSSELDYLNVDSTLTTGSSIMPQKKNVDVAELIRSKLHVMLGNLTGIISLSGNLLSGYNRDLQDSKKIVFESLELAENTIKAATFLVQGLTPNEERLVQAMTPELFATHAALEQTLTGTPFRDAHSTISKQLGNLNELHTGTLKEVAKQATHTGGTGNLGLSGLSQKISLEMKKLNKEHAEFKSVILNLLTGKHFEEVKTEKVTQPGLNSKRVTPVI